MAGRERSHRLSVNPAHDGENTRAALGGCEALDQRVGELPLRAHDLATVPLEGEPRARSVQPFPLTQKPSEMILEGFYRERVSPARGGCGRRG
jgi:hypothetical protein